MIDDAALFHSLLPDRMLLPSRTFVFMRSCVIASLAFIGASSDALAQLRPLDPTDFRALDGDRIRVQIGGGAYFEQHASLAGTRGRLLEIGDTRVSWRSGRILIEIGGTVQRFFREDTVMQPPAEGVNASTLDGTRHDVGDYRVQTVLRLTADTIGTDAILRFGTRLPTTDNRVGLERDQMDFFAAVGAGRALGRMHLGAEAGISINGTRLSNYEQSDVLIYAATIEYRGGLLAPFVAIVGQQDFHDWAARGNEDLGELRAGLRLGKQRWLSAVLLRGFHDSSPRKGFTLSLGAAFR
jgi:hypothetical protein